MRDDAWFAGFADGEASFQIAPRNRNRLAPIFTLALRADDIAVLGTLRDTFGGGLRTYVPKGSNPASYWWVSSKREQLGLVAYFDRFPLRAKKQHDYAIWRRAVIAYCADGSRSQELPALREALMAGRAYQAPHDLVVVQKPNPQLRLVA